MLVESTIVDGKGWHAAMLLVPYLSPVHIIADAPGARR